MSHLSVQLTVDRHRGGNTRIHGRVGESHQDVNVWKGPQPGDCYLEGQIEGAPTTLRINSAFAENGHKVFGRLAGVPFQVAGSTNILRVATCDESLINRTDPE